MLTYKGYVSAIIYRNRDNLYTVFELNADGERISCTGYPAGISEGELAEVVGDMVTHPVYGEQLKVAEYRASVPEGRTQVQRYLASGAVKGIGPALAGRIVKRFGEDTLRILNEEPERLSEVKGISERMAREIAASLEGQRELREAMLFLQQYGISGRRAVKIRETYGDEMYTVLRENPYRLAEDIDGIGFAAADEIASRIGIRADDDFRVRSGIQYVLTQNLENGSTWLPEDLLTQSAMHLLGVSEETVQEQLAALAAEHRVRMIVPTGYSEYPEYSEDTDHADHADHAGHADHADHADNADHAENAGNIFGSGGPASDPSGNFCPQDDAKCCGEFLQMPGDKAPVQVYPANAYRLEQRIACRLLQLDERPAATWSERELERRIRNLEEGSDIRLDDLQRRAVMLSATRGVLLISGGPGTGKTTTIRSIIRLFLADARLVVLAAPTGRAARRMTEATGYEAMTIHRLLECRVSGAPGEDAPDHAGAGAWYFDRNEENPLEADAVIIDEMSMVDLYLFDALLKAIAPGTVLILVGDINQLPSVGPGRVFGDLMESGQFESIVLQKIFRQAQESDIVMNAHRILSGEPLAMDNRSRDFFFLERDNPQVIYKHIILLLRDRLPGFTGASWSEMQVLTPMRRGPLGAVRLNEVLQSVLNPKEDGKAEITAHGVTFRVGDKVMQTRNNYHIEWEVPGPFGIPDQKGEGIFNGDFGVILGIDPGSAEMDIRFDDNRLVHYPVAELGELDLAYAVTVHKSQGSEYPAVILPILDGPKTLMNRNLLYTAVTRARQCVVILGSRDAVRRMEENVYESGRRSGLKERLLEM